VTAAVVRHSIKSSAGVDESRAEADRAMDWLRQAIGAGYDNLALMKKDSDLDVLRDRSDFLTRLAEVEARTIKK
jgi:hypothetical protein